MRKICWTGLSFSTGALFHHPHQVLAVDPGYVELAASDVRLSICLSSLSRSKGRGCLLDRLGTGTVKGDLLRLNDKSGREVRFHLDSSAKEELGIENV